MFELPAARRELLVIARSPALYRSRISSSIALLLMGIGFAFVYHFSGLRGIGPVAQMLTFILMTICIFIGVQLTSDSIAREKREGTIGLLFLTHLTAFQIVLGKLIANGLTGFYWLLMVVPLLSLMLIVGGLEGIQLATVAFGALNILFFSAAVGLFASAINTERKKAAAHGTWIVLFFWWGLPMLGEIARHYHLTNWLSDALSLLAISGFYTSPFAGPRVRVASSPWLNLLCVHLMGWAFVGLATFFLRRKWQDHPPKARLLFREWWRNLSLGNSRARLRIRRKLLERNPFLWLAARHRFRGISVWIATFIMFGFILYIIPFAGFNLGMVISLAMGISIFHKAMMAAGSAHQLQAEQEQGTLEMLTSTPLRVEEIIHGQLLASYRQFRGPVILLILLHLGVALFDWLARLLNVPFASVQLPPVMLWLLLLASATMYLFDLYAMAWAGMWAAVNVRDVRNAAGFALMRIVFLPFLAVAWIAIMASLARWYFGLAFNIPMRALALTWLALAVSNNLFWIFTIRKRLPEGIRTFALQRYSPEEQKTLFGMLGRALGGAWGRIRQNRAKRPPIIPSPGAA